MIGSEMRFLVCKKCGCQIEIDLCGFGCDLDNTRLEDRPVTDVDVYIYKFDRVEPYEPKELT